MDITIDLTMKKTKDEFIFTNLVDFDAKFGHRRDIKGYANAINDFDIKLAKLINAMNDDDLLIITSDHGNDPTFPGSDHTREYVPATIYSKSLKKPTHLGITIGAGVLGNIVAKNWDVKLTDIGEDIYDKLI
jgi:phosphopentomutase